MNLFNRFKKARDVADDVQYMDEVDAALHRKPLFGVLVLSLGTGAMFVFFLLWAAWAELDELTRAQGQVISSQRTQSIEHLEGGLLEGLFVREGAIVEKDSLLARVRNEASASAYRDALGKAHEHRIAIVRLNAALAGEVPQFDPQLRQNAPHLIQDQMSLHDERLEQVKAELGMLATQVAQRKNDVAEQKQRLSQVEKALAVAKEQIAISQGLIDRQLYSKVEFLNHKQRLITLQGDHDSLLIAIPKAENAAMEAEQKLAFRRAEIRSGVAEEINRRRVDLASLQETLTAGSDRVFRTDVRAPVRGTVKTVHMTTVGSVVKPGVPIMELVPLDDSLFVEARVRPSDIAFIHEGQHAMVKLSAYDFSIFGGLEGEVMQISADTIEDKRGEFYYITKVRTHKNAIIYNGEVLPILPGMVSTVDIITGKKSVLDFIVKPLLKIKQNALHER